MAAKRRTIVEEDINRGYGTTTIPTDSGGTRSATKVAPRPWYDVKVYGAKGDGTTNDTGAIQAACDAANTAGAGVIFFPAGTYITTQFTIGSNAWVRGVGAGLSILKNTASTAERGIITNKDQTNGNSNLTVSDLTLQRTVTNGNSFFDLIYFLKSSHIRIRNTRGTMAGTAATSPKGNKGYTCDQCKYTWIEDNYLIDAPDNHIAINGTGSSGNTGDAYAWVQRNHLLRTTTGSNWAGSAIIATANYCWIHDNSWDAGDIDLLVEISGGPKYISVRGNKAPPPPSSGDAIALLTTRQVTSLEIANNLGGAITVTSDDGATTAVSIHDNDVSGATGLVVKKGTGGTLTNIFVTNNLIHNVTSTNQAVQLQAIGGLLFSGNHVRNIDYVGVYAVGSAGATDYLIENNLVVSCGLVQGGLASNSNGSGFVIERGAAGTITLHNNVSNSNAGYGYFFEQPQNNTWLDDDGASNTTGYVFVNNPTLQGAVPFLNVRFRGTGAPSFYGNPGAIYYRTDGGNTTSVYIKESANTSNAGWLPVQPIGLGSNIASAGTVAVGQGTLFHITGTTNITSVTASTAGRMVTLIFDDVLTFTDGSNLILAGNFATTANDTITLICDGTNWYEVARSVN